MADYWMLFIKSALSGGLVGFAVAAGAARMFRAPDVQGLGSFRTFGELNACVGDPIAHFSFGLGFFFNAWASVIAAGALTSEVPHRIMPHWSAALTIWRNRDLKESLQNPRAMGIAGAVIGVLVVTLLNTTTVAIPESLRLIASRVLEPASGWFINYVMPMVFWLAALEAGKRTGAYGTILGGMAQLVMGNAVPGVVLGILIGKGVDESGWNHITRAMVIAVTLLFSLSGFFRSFDIKILKAFGLGAPQWLIDLHGLFGMVVK